MWVVKPLGNPLGFSGESFLSNNRVGRHRGVTPHPVIMVSIKKEGANGSGDRGAGDTPEDTVANRGRIGGDRHGKAGAPPRPQRGSRPPAQRKASRLKKKQNAAAATAARLENIRKDEAETHSVLTLRAVWLDGFRKAEGMSMAEYVQRQS